MKLIGVIGPIGAGKDTIAEYLIQTQGFKKLSFASRVKDVAAVAFGWDRTLLEGDTFASRVWRETTDPVWNITPRHALQQIGTEMFRAHIADDFWIRIVQAQIKQAEPNTKGIVITDCRFENEIQMIQRMGGIILHVQRDPPPLWAKEAMEGIPFDTDRSIHITEWNAWAFSPNANYHIENTGSLDFLHEQIQQCIID